MVLFHFVHGIALTFMFVCHKAVNTNFLQPTKIFAGELLVENTGWLGIEKNLFAYILYL